MKIHAKDGHSGTYIHISVSDPEGDAAIMARKPTAIIYRRRR